MKLTYNEETERYNAFSCGDQFKIKANDKWAIVRIELNSKGWYLIDEYGFISYCKNLEGSEIEELY